MGPLRFPGWRKEQNSRDRPTPVGSLSFRPLFGPATAAPKPRSRECLLLSSLPTLFTLPGNILEEIKIPQNRFHAQANLEYRSLKETSNRHENLELVF
jgi:hypothetical protein